MDANEALKQYRRNIYEFIDYLYEYASDMKIDLETIDEIRQLGQKQGELDYRGNYNDRVKYEELKSKINDKIDELSFPNLIDVKAKELKLYQYSTIEIRNNLDPARHILDDIKPKEIQQIIESKDKYLTFRKETQFCTFLTGTLFIDLDEGLREFFRLFTDVSDMERVLPQPIPTPQPQIEPEEIKNNFDSGNIKQVIEHFRELEKYMKNGEFMEWIKQAFELMQPPEQKFFLNEKHMKSEIRKLFYSYYRKLGKKGNKAKYVKLLTDYFYGFDFQNTMENFNK